MKYLLIILYAGAITGLLGLTPIHQEPQSKCEVTVYRKKRKGILPCIVGVLRDSATQKPLVLAPLVINGIVLWVSKEGRTYTNVVSGKYTLEASAFTYYPGTQKVVAHEGDSIVCVFNMRRSREGSDGSGDFIIIHK